MIETWAWLEIKLCQFNSNGTQNWIKFECTVDESLCAIAKESAVPFWLWPNNEKVSPVVELSIYFFPIGDVVRISNLMKSFSPTHISTVCMTFITLHISFVLVFISKALVSFHGERFYVLMKDSCCDVIVQRLDTFSFAIESQFSLPLSVAHAEPYFYIMCCFTIWIIP